MYVFCSMFPYYLLFHLMTCDHLNAILSLVLCCTSDFRELFNAEKPGYFEHATEMTVSVVLLQLEIILYYVKIVYYHETNPLC